MMLAMLQSVILATLPAVMLAEPRRDGGPSLERTIAERRTTRDFRAAALPLLDVAQLAWAAQGAVARGERRTTPSAGALYPLELYVVAGNVDGIQPGVYHYDPLQHRLDPRVEGDRRKALAQAALGQHWLERAPAVLVIAGVEKRTTARYGPRGVRYVHMEAGHAAQNVLLQAGALGLGAAPVGAFDDEAVRAALALARDAHPLYLIPVGRPR